MRGTACRRRRAEGRATEKVLGGIFARTAKEGCRRSALAASAAATEERRRVAGSAKQRRDVLTLRARSSRRRMSRRRRSRSRRVCPSGRRGLVSAETAKQARGRRGCSAEERRGVAFRRGRATVLTPSR